jgi:hypothetical protein
VSYCNFVKPPAFWAALPVATLQPILQATHDFGGVDVVSAIATLLNTDDSFDQYLLATELNAVWDGNAASPGVGSPPRTMSFALYYSLPDTSDSLDGVLVSSLLSQAFADIGSPPDNLTAAITYLGGGGSASSYLGSNCAVIPWSIAQGPCVGEAQVCVMGPLLRCIAV